jgi:hypothetical protein
MLVSFQDGIHFTSWGLGMTTMAKAKMRVTMPQVTLVQIYQLEGEGENGKHLPIVEGKTKQSTH